MAAMAFNPFASRYQTIDVEVVVDAEPETATAKSTITKTSSGALAKTTGLERQEQHKKRSQQSQQSQQIPIPKQPISAKRQLIRIAKKDDLTKTQTIEATIYQLHSSNKEEIAVYGGQQVIIPVHPIPNFEDWTIVAIVGGWLD